MNLIHVAAAVLNQTPLAWETNKRNIVAAIRQAQSAGAGVVCLPELCITGYGCEDAFHSPGVQKTALEVLLEILPETSELVVSLGLPLMHRGGLYNAVCLAVDGEIAGFVCKQNLAGDGIHYEPRWFKPWPDEVRSQAHLAGRVYPMGDLIFDIGGVLMGFEVCEDAWVARRPGADLAERSVDLVLNPSASHFAFGKHEIRRRFVLEGSRAFHAGYIYANLLGNEAGRAIYDGDAMIAAEGKMLAVGPWFCFEDYYVTTAVIDIDRCRMGRAQTTSFQPDIVAEEEIVRRPFDFPPPADEGDPGRSANWERGKSIKCEEFSRAVALGLLDYLRKSFSRGFVVSLSGGADSSAVAVLVRLMVDFGVASLGRDGFCRKLAHLPELAAAPDNAALTASLLTTAYQSTRNSSTTTREAARGVAKAIGARHLELDVEGVVESYKALVSAAIGRQLSWERDDIALQNIQARARAPSVWMLSNLGGALLLATSNRSEAAVGYATMDGDTCGGVSPIAGIDKAFLRRWLRWMESAGPEESGPLPALALVNSQQPTAELRPAAAAQTDEGDLMPYDLLDEIERAAIRDRLTPMEVFRRFQRTTDYSPNQLAAWIERFFRLWCRNQWKRERYAPSFHLDDENLDPKTWCRFPILSGGYERELAELREMVGPAEAHVTD